MKLISITRIVVLGLFGMMLSHNVRASIVYTVDFEFVEITALDGQPGQATVTFDESAFATDGV